MAMAQGFTKEQVESIINDISGTDLVDEKTKALLRFANKMTTTPHQIIDEDIQALRNLGLPDDQILEGIHVISFFNYMDRMADATGAPVENLQEAMAQAG